MEQTMSSGPHSRRALLGLAAAAGVGAVLAAGSGVTGTGDIHAQPATPQPGAKATITLADAQKLLSGAIAKAIEIRVPMYLVIIDESGLPKASLRMDGNSLAALELVPPKAFTALSFRTPTHMLAEGLAQNPARLASILANPKFTVLGGGFPVLREGALIGAMAAGGGSPEQDQEVVEAGLAALAG